MDVQPLTFSQTEFQPQVGRSVSIEQAAHFLDRIHQHALGSADSPDGAETAVTNAVVDGAPRHAEQLGRLFDADAAAKLGLKLSLRKRQWLHIHQGK